MAGYLGLVAHEEALRNAPVTFQLDGILERTIDGGRLLQSAGRWA